MAERPILFSGPMVRAILEGRKTQTRRVVKPQPPSIEDVRARSGSAFSVFTDDRSGEFRVAGPVWAVHELMGAEPRWKCSYGVPGDRLWLKEAWAHDAPDLDAARAAHEDALGGAGYAIYYRATEVSPDTLRWRSPRFMPRWASRITLEVTDVRVERIRDISEEDARAEGVTPLQMDNGSFRPRFEGVWDSINAKRGYGWESNPWVWAISFRRQEPTP